MYTNALVVARWIINMFNSCMHVIPSTSSSSAYVGMSIANIMLHGIVSCQVNDIAEVDKGQT